MSKYALILVQTQLLRNTNKTKQLRSNKNTTDLQSMIFEHNLLCVVRKTTRPAGIDLDGLKVIQHIKYGNIFILSK